MNKICLIFLGLLVAFSSFSQNEEKRIALIIGNSNYENAPLKNPVNDANLMANTLLELGFTIIKVEDANRMQMAQSIADFWSKLGTYNVALFFYAGHGIQVNGINYLIPVDATLNTSDMISFEAISVNDVVAKFELYPRNTNIVILDACRNNPFRSWARGNEYGFKAMNPGSGTLIAFATSEGATASDGTGDNGLFTENLVKHLKKPIPIETIFKNTRIDVQNASNGNQSPQEWTKLTGDFYFMKGEGQLQGVVIEDKIIEQDRPQVIKNADLTISEEIHTGSIRIINNLEGDFYFDGKFRGKFLPGRTYNLEKIKVGNHQLKIENWSRNVIVEKEKTIEILTLNEIIGSFKDERDGRLYKTVQIGNQIWMAENLNYQFHQSFCYDKNKKNCEQYGRLYNWQVAQNICPKGWHIPSTDEFEALINNISEDNKRGFLSSSAKGFIDFSIHSGGCKNAYGFYRNIGSHINYWTSVKRENYSAWFLNIEDKQNRANIYYDDISNAFSVRCIKDY
jgi:uncharacterized protein (TIGR02145 family)